MAPWPCGAHTVTAAGSSQSDIIRCKKTKTKQNTCLTVSVRFTEEGFYELWYFGPENRTVFTGRIKVISIIIIIIF